MLWSACISIVSFAILQLFMGECFTTMKRRLCVDFEMDHKRARYDVMSAQLCLSRSQCMMKCVADARCIAFNFRSGDGLCELLPGLPKCYEPDDHDDFIFTHLKLPDFNPLMAKQSKPPDTRDLQWVPCNSTTVPSSSNIEVANDGYVGLGFYKGMYLPAYWKASKAQIRFLSPSNKSVRCAHGYLLSVQNPKQFEWVSSQTGSPIPIGSVSAGSHVDATPLYVVRIICEAGKRCGFYSSSFKRAYVSCQFPIDLDGEIEILLHEWYESWGDIPTNNTLFHEKNIIFEELTPYISKGKLCLSRNMLIWVEQNLI